MKWFILMGSMVVLLFLAACAPRPELNEDEGADEELEVEVNDAFVVDEENSREGDSISGAVPTENFGYIDCIDSDGGADDIGNTGTVTYTKEVNRARLVTNSITDACVGNSRLDEYYCDEYNRPRGRQLFCEKDSCRVGRCEPR